MRAGNAPHGTLIIAGQTSLLAKCFASGFFNHGTGQRKPADS